MPKYILGFLLTFFHAASILAADYSINVDYINMQDGLSDNNVNAILKDNKGFIWFGTSDGLNRYDGYQIKSFYPVNGSVNISVLYQSPKGYIWVGTADGLHIFNPESESFISHIENLPNIPSFSISGIAGDIRNGILLTTPLGIICLNFEDETIDVKTIRCNLYNKGNTSGLDYDVLSNITKERDGVYWLGTNTNKIVRFDINNHAFKSFSLPSLESSNSQFIITKLSYIHGQLIISTIGNGVFIFEPDTYQITQLEHDSNNTRSISHRDVYGVEKDNRGDYWIATWDGLDQISNLDNLSDIKHYNWDHPLFTDRFENRAISILYDPSGVIWVGTHGGGAVKIDIENQFYRSSRFNSLYEVQDFTIDNSKNLYISLYHGGIKKTSLPLPLDSSIHFDQFSTRHAHSRRIPEDIILSSTKDENGDIWFGTIKSSLLKYDPNIDQIKRVDIKISNFPDWQGRIESLLIDSKGRFWIGSNNGLLLYDRISEAFHLTQSNDKPKYHLSGNHIRVILEDSDSSIWIGTNLGLNKLIYHETDSFKFNSFNDKNSSPHTLHNKEVWALHQMPDGKLWIGYRGGLGYFNAKEGNIHFLNKRDGLCHNFVTCLTSIGDSTLWIGTNSGLSKFDIYSKKFINYYIANNVRAVQKTDTDQLIWGNNKGIIYFHPDSIRKNTFISPTVITEIRVKNRAIEVNESWDGQTILSKAAPYTSAITLKHPFNSFAIDYVGLSFLHQQSNKYAYRLVNHETNWIHTNGTQRTVTYNNLSAGDYIFEVKSSNNDGIWNTNTTSLEISIQPPWYSTLWGIVTIFLIVILLIYTILKIRIRQIYREQQLKSQAKELEHKLTIEKVEREKEHDIAEMKARFFTNISHELRTPLTLITAPLKEILDNKDISKTIKNKLKIVNQHARQLHQLISQLLDLRKAEMGSMVLNVSKNNIVNFVKEVENSFNQYAQKQNITIHILHSRHKIPMWFDTEKLRIVLSNIISNAIKFSPTNETITISIDKEEDWCKISITDKGPGIELNQQELIFDRFFQGKESNNIKQTGTGIGLSLARELIHLHKGSINVVSKPKQGATFNIKIPIDNKLTNERNTLKLGDLKEIYISEEPFIDQEDTSSTQDISNNEKKRPQLLIVEDHPELRQYIRSILDDEFEIYEATNGQEALQQINNKIPVLILSDVMMPVMDGIELCKTIKTNQTHCHIPVVLLSAKSTDQDVLTGLETGVDDYITKPFTPTILKAKINNIIKSRAQLKAYYGNKITLSPSEIEIDLHEKEFIHDAIQFVEGNLTNPKFNTQLLAEHLHMSQPTLYRRIKTITGENISVFVRSIRIKKAAQMLVKQNIPIIEISEQIGFNDVAYFRKCFTKQFGVNPSKYRAKNSGD
ncbi:hybrid sensor histidine kinase/response regulator transcription factor [Carboxylicivirga sp. N1Y90]|uniref:hybrid sensor histidine kinase/response regulator transcription factor n=1 Tax=Carboxylicivirga fragile TaxID=3417571 RepID=UPI003D32C741|nr:response regulator [Marinilabiliaceae bacterium N1Y90]